MYHNTYLCKSSVNYMCFAAYFLFCFPTILARKKEKGYYVRYLEC